MSKEEMELLKKHLWYFEQTELPLKEEFYSKLNEEDITDADYARAKEIWNRFKINKFRRIP